MKPDSLSIISQRTRRREFLKQVAAFVGSTALLAELPWWSSLRAAPVSDAPSNRVRIGLVGVGSRGNLHISHLLRTPGVEIAALCDDYEPHLNAGLARVKGAKGFSEFRKMLEMPNLDGVLIALPLNLHSQFTLDAMSAGKHVYCEKSLAYTIEQCQAVANAYRGSKKVFQVGHQRLYSPSYLHAYELVKKGAIGDIKQIRAYWHRNGNWRNPVPSPELEHRLNWRLYRAYSCGLMTELASHHMQVANWFLGQHPLSVVGYGSINYWKDGRELYDNVNVVYKYAGGVHVIFDSLISNRFYGMEVQMMGPKGTIESETGRMFSETPPPAPGIVQLINGIERGVFETIPIGGPSWVPDLKKNTKAAYFPQEPNHDDGTGLALAAFANAIRLNEPIPGMMEQACHSGVAVLMGQMAMEQGREVTWPEDFKI
jgi:predicted dehydrogenase